MTSNRRRAAPLALALLLAAALPAAAQNVPPNALGVEPGAAKGPQFQLLKQVAFEQNLNAQLPLDTPLRDESGRAVTLGDYFGKKPVVLLFVYYECPMLCSLELNGLVRNLRTLSLTAGQDFELVTVSFDPKDTPQLAAAKKRGYLERYNRPGSEAGWHFLTGDAAPVKRLTGVAGFTYALDPKSGQYAHPAGLIVATPSGRISRYVYGVDFPASNLRWALTEASGGKVGSPVDKLLLMCFHYDPSTGRYNFAVMSAVRLLGLATFGGLAAFALTSLRRERRARGAPAAGV